MENNINNKKSGKFITGRRIFLLIPLIVLIFVIANHYSCVMSGGTLCCLDGLSEVSRILIYNLIFYFYVFYIFYLVAYIFTKNHSNRIFVAVVVIFLLPFIVLSSAVIRDISASPLEWGIGAVFVVYIAAIAPGALFESFLNKNFSNPDIKELSVKKLRSSYIRKDASILWEEARYQGNSLIVPVLISGEYLRAVKITPKATNASYQIESLFTVGPRSFTPITHDSIKYRHELEERHELEADYERELLNRGILNQEEWDISEWNPIVWDAIAKQGNLIKAFRVKQDNISPVLLAIIGENIQETRNQRSPDIWLFDPQNLEKPINLTLTAFNDSLAQKSYKPIVSQNYNWIYILGDIFTRITFSGNRDDSFEQEWNTFIESSGFSSARVTAVDKLRNGCLIVAFSPDIDKSNMVKWLWLAQHCGNNGFELIGNGKLQVPFDYIGGIPANKIYELNDDNLLIELNRLFVIKFNIKHKKFDNDFQKNLTDVLQLISEEWGGKVLLDRDPVRDANT